ncbi:hypothetical protein ABEB36_004049 [Hypothenemus hampei]|uniref:THAP-type domain-containing protein n=1 Tax=Hypothenemus hampei TaxID=57062 RepID=A0ABD1F2K7_HYPHA
METKTTYYKYCLVSQCKSTTVQTPDKIFLRLPEDKNRRKKWLRACRRNEKEIAQNSKALHVCEDHFNLEEDMDNYIKFKLMGGQKKMKPEVVPHIFNCQPDRKRTFTQAPRPLSEKRARRKIIDDALASTSTTSYDNLENDQPDHDIQLSESCNKEKQFFNTNNVATQTCFKFRSKNIQCCIHSGITVGLSPMKTITTEVACSPIKIIPLRLSPVLSLWESLTSRESADKSYIASDYSLSDEDEELERDDKRNFQIISLKCTLTKLKNRPKFN